MTLEVADPVLKGSKSLVVGICNESDGDSIAYGCATLFREPGADLAFTHLNERASPHLEPEKPQADHDGSPPHAGHRRL